MDEQQRQSAGSTEPAGTEGMGKGEQWVITFGDNAEIAKIEKLNPQSSERQELSEEEYAAVAGWDLSGASDYSDYYGSGMSGMEGYMGYGAMDPTGYEEAYYQGLSDAMEAAYGTSGESPEEMAYYQGVEDYMAFCM